ncbi:MAG: HAMP domain-containing histidine kinase [Clostridiales bacterium]|nr:HAMP domain-containing histidine kinase [Clostridiales bacterium]
MKNKFSSLKSRMVFRLWISMMIPVLFGIAFMWVVLIVLFEQNYAEAAIQEARDRLGPIMQNLQTEDLSSDDMLIPYLSHMSRDVLLISSGGRVLQMYSSGHLVNAYDQAEEQKIWDSIRSRKEYENLLNGIPYEYVVREERHNNVIGFEMGFPTTYDGETCYIILREGLMTRTVLALNRRQLIQLSILLTVIASILAAVLSRLFTRPIYEIKDSIDQLARNDLSPIEELGTDDELGQLSHSVFKLRGVLLRLDVLRKEVIANVSHELRSPLALISGYAEMVRDITWRDEAQRTENLNLIISESSRMSEMVSDILDYSQFQAGYISLKKQPTNLCDILASEVSRCRAASGEFSISVSLAVPAPEITLNIDSLKTSQVLRNLLNNAANHTASGGQIQVAVFAGKDTGLPDTSCDALFSGSVSSADASGNRRMIPAAVQPSVPDAIRVSVSNPGPPLSEEDRELIWERYQRSQHQSGRRMGTGIGLSIVSTILQAHEMAYGVDCEDGWNIFWFECPFHAA